MAVWGATPLVEASGKFRFKQPMQLTSQIIAIQTFKHKVKVAGYGEILLATKKQRVSGIVALRVSADCYRAIAPNGRQSRLNGQLTKHV